MSQPNESYAYFAMTGDFDPEMIARLAAWRNAGRQLPRAGSALRSS
jgi:hypothetical protein